MRRANEEVLDVVAVLHVHPGHAAPAALLRSVRRQRQRLDVAGLRDRDDHLLLGDQVLDADLVLGVGDHRAALVAEAVGDLRQLLGDDREHARLVAEDRPQLADPLDLVGVLGLDRVGLQRRQLRQAQVEDRGRLDLRQPELRDEVAARRLAVARRADQRDDRVEVVERDQQSLEHVDAALEHAQLVLRAAHDDLALVLDVVLDDLAQRQRPRHVLDERDHVHAERRLQRRVLVELVEHDLGDLVALERDHDPHAAASRRVVLELGDAGDLLLVDELGDLLDHAAVATLLHRVRQLRDDDRLAPAPDVLGVRLAAHPHAPATGLVGVEDPRAAEDDPAGREVRARAGGA